jgi:hypothetical protein
VKALFHLLLLMYDRPGLLDSVGSGYIRNGLSPKYGQLRAWFLAGCPEIAVAVDYLTRPVRLNPTVVYAGHGLVLREDYAS